VFDDSQSDSGSAQGDLDTIETYLAEPPIPKEVIKSSGGGLKYWESMISSRPKLAKMAIDFLSAPGVFIDFC
jgi:hypothetical protein